MSEIETRGTRIGALPGDMPLPRTITRGVAYFVTYADAARMIAWLGEGRPVYYLLGWAIQREKSGPYYTGDPGEAERWR